MENWMSAEADVVVLSRSDWMKGIALSILASIIGGASKLAIRKSWILQAQIESQQVDVQVVDDDDDEGLDNNNNNNLHEEIRNEHDVTPFIPHNDIFLERMETSSIGSRMSEKKESMLSIQQSDRCTPLLVSPIALTSSHDVTREDYASSSFHRCCCRFYAFIRSYSCGDSYRSNENLIYHARKRLYIPHTLRVAGMIGMTTLNPLCSVIAMNYASPSILAPFAGLTLVWIIICAGPVLDEHPTWIQLGAVSLIIIGETIVAVFGDHTNSLNLTTRQVVCIQLE
jgi:hypothetical protein